MKITLLGAACAVVALMIGTMTGCSGPSGERVHGPSRASISAAPASGAAMAVLVAAHRGYAYHDPETGEPQVVAALKRGFADLLRAAPVADRAAVWVYRGEGLASVAPWGAARAGADAVETIDDTLDARLAPPSLYGALEAVLTDIGDRSFELPPRRAVLVVSDGKDEGLGEPEALEATLARLTSLAASAGVTVEAIGFTLDMDEPLAHLRALAEATGGAYQTLSPDADEVGLTTAIAQLGAGLGAR